MSQRQCRGLCQCAINPLILDPSQCSDFFYFLTFIIFLTAGMDDPSRPLMTLQKALNDDKRIRYHRDYLSNLSAAIRY